MSTNNQNPVNNSSFLRTTRDFPNDAAKLSTEMNRGYIDIANAVNNRTIGTHQSNKPSLNGENWFLTSARQQGLRQIYPFTVDPAGTPANIPHGLTFSNIDRFTQCYGAYTDGTNWYGIIFASSSAIANQLTFYLTPTNITFVGVGFPPATKGTIVLQWLSVT